MTHYKQWVWLTTAVTCETVPVGFSFQGRTFLSRQTLMNKSLYIGNCVNETLAPSLRRIPTDVWLAPLPKNWLVKEITTASGHIVWTSRTGMTDFAKGWDKTLMWLMVLLLLMKLLSYISPDWGNWKGRGRIEATFGAESYLMLT